MYGACSTHGEEERCVQSFGKKKPLERDHLEDPEVDGRIILRWIFRKWGVGVWAETRWLRIGTDGGLL
jgi:hypothetical protein